MRLLTETEVCACSSCESQLVSVEQSEPQDLFRQCETSSGGKQKCHEKATRTRTWNWMVAGRKKKKNQSKVKMSHDSQSVNGQRRTPPRPGFYRRVKSRTRKWRWEVTIVMHVCSKLHRQSGRLIWRLQNKNPQVEEEEEVSQMKDDGILEMHQLHYK